MKRIALALAVTVASAAFPYHSSASVAPGIQGLVLTGTVDFFPCIVGSCGGTLSGQGAASVSGLSVTNAPFSAEWPDPKIAVPPPNSSGTLSDVVDFCAAGGPTPSSDGSGNGSFKLTGGLLVYHGQELQGATLSGYFSFIREIDGLAVTISSATVADNTGTTVATQANLVAGEGAGAWAVTSGVATCGAPLTSPTLRISVSYLAPM
jgi:hypothetical protein